MIPPVPSAVRAVPTPRGASAPSRASTPETGSADSNASSTTAAPAPGEGDWSTPPMKRRARPPQERAAGEARTAQFRARQEAALAAHLSANAPDIARACVRDVKHLRAHVASTAGSVSAADKSKFRTKTQMRTALVQALSRHAEGISAWRMDPKSDARRHFDTEASDGAPSTRVVLCKDAAASEMRIGDASAEAFGITTFYPREIARPRGAGIRA